MGVKSIKGLAQGVCVNIFKQRFNVRIYTDYMVFK